MNTPNICLSGLANSVERTDLDRTAMPMATRSYQPVPHKDFVDLVELKMRESGFVFGEQTHALWRDNDARYFGMVQLRYKHENSTFALMLGMRNSYDKSISAQLLLGANVFLCANMSYSAANVVGRKHTTNIMRDLPDMIEEQVQKTGQYATVQEDRFSAYQESKLTDARADRLMVGLLRADAIQTSKFGRMVSEWYEPSYAHGPKTAWRLFNACTEALKGTPTHDLPRRTLLLQDVMDQQVCFH